MKSDLISQNIWRKEMLTSLPPELLFHINTFLPPPSLSTLSSTCTSLHTAVHQSWVSRLAQQSSLHPAVRYSLSRIGWTKEHDEWGCECSQLVAGPWLCWPRLARSEATIEGDSNVSVGVGCTVANNKVFCCPKARGVQWRHRSRLSETSGGVLVEFDHLPEYNRYPLHVTQHHNTLVVKALESHQGYRRGDYTISIFNCETLVKVGNLNPAENVRDVKSLSEMEIGNLAMCDDIIAVHIMFDVNQENDIDEEVEIENIRENETQLWRIKTSDPKLSDLKLIRTVKHPLAFCSLLDPGLVSVNNKFLTRIGTPTAFNLNQIQWFRRDQACAESVKISDEGVTESESVGYLPVSVLSSHDYNRASVRLASLCGGDSEYIAVGLELGIEHRDKDHSYLIVVQVYHVTRGQVVAEVEFGTSNHIDEKIKMSWFGPHLLVLSRQKSNSSLFSWQPGFTSFRESPCKVQVGSVHWGIDWIWGDFEGFVAANVNFGLEHTILQTYHPVQRLRKRLKIGLTDDS